MERDEFKSAGIEAAIRDLSGEEKAWHEITDDSPIHWYNDGWEVVRFGDVKMGQDRKTIEWDAQEQRFVGGYPF